MCHLSAFVQGTTVDDVPLLRVANRPNAASGLKATSSGSLAVALPDGRRRYDRLERLPSSHFGSIAFAVDLFCQRIWVCPPAAQCERVTNFWQ